MGLLSTLAMLATLGGSLALLLGLAILLLPLLATELSRPRDSFWGAVVLLLGLVLVTSAERLSGAPMLGVLCGGLLIGRLGLEVGQGRWRLLSDEERLRLGSLERWRTSVSQAGSALAQLLIQIRGVSAGLGAWLAERRRQVPANSKRWIRPEPEGGTEAQPPEQTATEPADEAAVEAASTATAEPAAIEVASFAEIDALIEAAGPEAVDSAEGKPETTSEAG